jgi:hypothetical protein
MYLTVRIIRPRFPHVNRPRISPLSARSSPAEISPRWRPRGSDRERVTELGFPVRNSPNTSVAEHFVELRGAGRGEGQAPPPSLAVIRGAEAPRGNLGGRAGNLVLLRFAYPFDLDEASGTRSTFVRPPSERLLRYAALIAGTSGEDRAAATWKRGETRKESGWGKGSESKSIASDG